MEVVTQRARPHLPLLRMILLLAVGRSETERGRAERVELRRGVCTRLVVRATASNGKYGNYGWYLLQIQDSCSEALVSSSN